MYSELYKAWRREKENAELQSLPKDFYSQLSAYMKKLEEEQRMLDEKSSRAKLLMVEYRYAKRLITELFQARLTKITMKIIDGANIPLEAYVKEEETLRDNLASIRETQAKILAEIIEGRAPLLEKLEAVEKPKKILVRFVQPLPAIVGVDMKSYGPFKPEDIAALPTENVDALLRQGVAVKVEVENESSKGS